MLKFNQDGQRCNTCIGLHRCKDSRDEVTGNRDHFNCSRNNFKYYANTEQVQAMGLWAAEHKYPKNPSAPWVLLTRLLQVLTFPTMQEAQNYRDANEEDILVGPINQETN